MFSRNLTASHHTFYLFRHAVVDRPVACSSLARSHHSCYVLGRFERLVCSSLAARGATTIRRGGNIVPGMTRKNLARSGSRSLSDSSSSSSSSASPESFAQELVKLSETPGGLEGLAHQLDPATRQLLTQQITIQQQAAARSGASTAQSAPEPAFQDLKAVALTTSIPFLGFGFMDNAILILAGDAIDTSFGVLLGISTMCAAAIGNIVSDVAGIMLGTVIEDFCAKHLNMPAPHLTTAQRQLRSVRFANQFGCAVGIVVGCIIGMFPLMFIDSNKIQARKREAHLDTIFQDVVNEAGSLIGAQRVCLFLLVDGDDENSLTPNPDGKYLYAKYDTVMAGKKKKMKKKQQQVQRTTHFFPLGRGIVSRAALTGESWNIYDVRTEPDFASEMGGHDSNERLSQDDQIRNMVCVPVLDAQGRVIAVLQAMNKVGKGVGEEQKLQRRSTDLPASVTPSQLRGFTSSDVQILKGLASHISVSLQRMYENGEEDDAEMRLRDTITMLKDYGLEGITGGPSTEQRNMLFPED